MLYSHIAISRLALKGTELSISSVRQRYFDVTIL